MNAAQLAAVLARPDDDDVRLNVARELEAAGDPRGEFIRLQVARAAADRAARRPRRSREGPREDELLRAHAATWAAEVGPFVTVKPVARGFAFHRGFVAYVAVTSAADVDLAMSRAPIQHVECSKYRADVAAFLAAPWLRRLRSLSLTRVGVDDALATALAKAPAMATLRAVSLTHNGIGRPGVEALVASPHFASKAIVDLTGNPCDPREQPVADESGRVLSLQADPVIHELEAKYGKRAWLHFPWDNVNDAPDRWMV
jgi:uncharacterized protein (TIGR02996 family)